MNNLLTAVMTKFSGSALSADVNGRIFFDEAPEQTEFPYVIVQIIHGSPQDTFKDTIEDTILQVSLYSASESVSEVTTMYTDLKALFDWQVLIITGNTCIWVMREGLTTMFDDVTLPTGTVGLRHWAVDYSIMVQKT